MKTIILGLCLFGALFWSSQSMPVSDVVPPAVPSDTEVDSQKPLVSNSENVAEIPANDANPKSDVKPEAETKPAAEAKPVDEIKPSDAKSESELKSTIEEKSEIAKSDLQKRNELVQASSAPAEEKEIKKEKITLADAVEGPRSDLEAPSASETKSISETKAEPEAIKPNNEVPVALPLNPTEAKDTKSATLTDIKQEEKAAAAILADPIPAAATAPILPVAEEPKLSESIPVLDTKIPDQSAKLLESESIKPAEDTITAASAISETKVNPSVPAADAPASSEVDQTKQPSPAPSTVIEVESSENSPKSEAIQPAIIPKEEKKPIEEVKPAEQQRSEPQIEETKPAEQPKSETKPAELPKSETKPAELPKSETKPAELPKSETKADAAKPAEQTKSEIEPEAVKPNEEKKSETASSDEKKEHSVNKRDALKEKKLTETYKKEDKKQKQKKAN
ncbi:enolase-phosphatase E1-like [Daktulosphaira vitifoliae]|uniref:enolase-phosphatase E1-like n=1 Tax=Daktulosphaira vitifoliae TaxID=58002 RepID=UPI0021AA37AD|nr:enolase-phosphatase E1-like [Daktulosphaira vitifoliae]XP_050534936.1 enolase-phosphatase E1-like [Daktulosphaira vitifoliae]